MSRSPYIYNKESGNRYNFISSGNRSIIKVVEFTPTSKNIYNLGFGDLLPDGEIDDTVKSNNGDIIKVFATVIDILQDFTKINPSFIIAFEGSTFERTRLYNRIIRTYYQSFRKTYFVLGAIETEAGRESVPFDPTTALVYSVFFVKRIE
jgi:uncharacterized protein DUF6934